MDPPRRRCAWALALTLFACRPSIPEPATFESAVAHALATLPWDHGTSDAEALCPTLGPCDTLWLEPRLVQLPTPAPAFFVPDARVALRVLGEAPAAAPSGTARLRRPLRFGPWSDCLARRHDPAWPTYRRACVAVGIAGDTVPADTLQAALLVLSPTQGLHWPRVRLVRRPSGGWRGELLSMGGE